MKKTSKQAANLEGDGLLQMYFSTFLLMITNPITILNFAAMFAGLGFSQDSNTVKTSILMITGVLLGATFWWVTLSIGVSIFRNKITPHVGLVNKLAGILIILLALLSFMK